MLKKAEHCNLAAEDRNDLENADIDPSTSHMLSEYPTIWGNHLPEILLICMKNMYVYF